MVLKMKNRLISEIKKLVLIGCAGGIYGIWILITGRYIPCLFNELTGLECPGCGVSHMAMALFRLDFREAFEYNPFLFVIIPIIALQFNNICLSCLDVLFKDNKDELFTVEEVFLDISDYI